MPVNCKRPPKPNSNPLASQPASQPASLLILGNNIRLGAPLCRLPIIMSHARLLLLLAIAHKPGHSALDAALDALPDPRAVVPQLALGFLAFSLGVLALAGLLQARDAQGAAEGFFGGADGLIPGAFGAGGVVS